MQVVILAGGLGTRMRAAGADLPKSLIPVAGRPFVERQLELLVKSGLRDILLCVGYGGDRIEAHVGDGARWGARVGYSREDPGRLLGTGGALVKALPQLQDRFLVLYGDSYLPTDYRAVVQAFRGSPSPVMMCVFRNEGRGEMSNVRVGGGKVVFYSKTAAPGEADFVDYGLSGFRRAAVERCADEPLPLDLAQVVANLVARGELGAFEVRELFGEIGKPEGLAELDRRLRANG